MSMVRNMLILLLAAPLLLTSCFTTTTLINPMILPLNSVSPIDSVEQAIVKAATDRQWQLSKVAGRQFIGTLRVREHSMKVKIGYSKDRIIVSYVSSENLDYDGVHIHKKYHMWIDRFFASVRAELKI